MSKMRTPRKRSALTSPWAPPVPQSSRPRFSSTDMNSRFPRTETSPWPPLVGRDDLGRRGLGLGCGGGRQDAEGGDGGKQGAANVHGRSLGTGFERSDKRDCMRKISVDWSATTAAAKSDSRVSWAASGRVISASTMSSAPR